MHVTMQARELLPRGFDLTRFRFATAQQASFKLACRAVA